MAGPGDELVEEVDEAGTVLRVVTRAEMRSQRLRHRTTFVAVVDDDGRLLIHQRSPDKDVWPSRWDIAAGGVAAVGEDWHDGARRELAEELGIDSPLIDLGRGSYEDDDVATVAAVFATRYSGEVRFADGEVVAAKWVTRSELDAALATEAFCPDSVALVLPAVHPLLA